MAERMIPGAGLIENLSILDPKDKPSRTYRLDMQNGRLAGMVDGQEAMEQAIFKILQTQLFEHDIYSDQYGFAGAGLIGKSPAYVISELKKKIREALLSDGRISAVDQFVFDVGEARDALSVSFRVTTIFSAFQIESMGVRIK